MNALAWFARLLRWLSPFRKPVQEMADQRWGKQAKVDSLDQVISVRDIKELGDADRERAEDFLDLKMKQMNPSYQPSNKPAGDKDTWVCDDMTINSGGSRLPELALVCLAGLLAFWWLGKDKPTAAASANSSVTAPQVDPADGEYEIKFYDESGQQFRVDRWPPTKEQSK